MPIHLPPIKRRDFLAGSIAAGASLLLPRGLMAQPPRTDPNLWVLMADIHIPANCEKINDGIQPAKNIELAVKQILSLDPRPAGVVVAGDIAINHGEAGDYATLGELIEPLRTAGIPMHFALGNHDNRRRFLKAFPEAKKQAAADPESLGKYVSLVEMPHADWLLLDSLNRPDGVPGRMGEAELKWLAETLDKRSERPMLLVAHHNLDRKLKQQGLIDTAAMLDIVLPRKQAKAYFYGHTHCWNVKREGDLRLVNIPGNVWVFDKSQPRGFVTIQLRPEGANLKLHSLDRKHANHGENVSLRWRA